MKQYDESLFTTVWETQRFPRYYVRINEQGILRCGPKIMDAFLHKHVIVKSHGNALLIKIVEEQAEGSMVVKVSGNKVDAFAQTLREKGFVFPVTYKGGCPEDGIWYGETAGPPALKKTKKN